ncbi:hypothetical protein [Brevibacillus sp. NRS-1366]|uniref:hypothetical protein n=1 Tax=Brevibacillus sp. NRS-1366 TaxID=3233899 RepID=UPI003D23F1FA
MDCLIDVDKYINFKFIELSELKGKVIKDVFTNQYDNFSFIVTEDNEMSGYKLEWFSDSMGNDEFPRCQIYPLEFNDIVEFIMSNPHDYSFKVNGLINDPDGLSEEVEKIEEMKEVERLKLLKIQRYNQYLELKKEFEVK